MKRIALLLENFVEEVEFIYPLYRFKEEKFNITVLSPKVGEFKGKNGLTFFSNQQIEPNRAKEFDAVFIPGGYAPDRFRRDKETVDFIRNMYKENKIIGAICHAPWVLISAGIIKGKKITGFFSIKDDIKNAGAIYTGNPVEIDGNIITGTDPKAMPEMVKVFIKKLNGEL
ncbi:type 1 glutamine amidotransferase domain-containing protein [Hydrogenothermus marinus]|uniref:Protease I n=1 Tax=Hydrogenothermus marinus TaxID=133270 RepID=A0A3M0BJZ2_9AQUI|nr:type 1 glutamine amidotransferase domain-containing protein [Hydrogenothermus marinus]RMA97650.1 protease I [Hydrogenothermus marinus]